MMEDLEKKAAEMLLQGATLVSEPCPYCKGVRVIKDGTALCVSCGRTPKKTHEKTDQKPKTIQLLERKLETLSKELEAETDHQKQQEIIKSMDLLVDTISKLKRQ